MKLVYLHQYFTFPEETGATRSYDLATSFSKKGMAVEVITTSAFIKKVEFTKRWTIIEKDGIKLHVLNCNYRNGLTVVRRTLIFLKFLFFSTFKLFSIKCDLVLATSTPLTVGIPALLKKWLTKTPFIFEVRDVWPEAIIAVGAVKSNILKKTLCSLEKTIYKNAKAIIPLSVDMRLSIVSRYPHFANKIEVVENISEVNRFQKGYNPNSSILVQKIGFKPKFSILYAGTFGRINGISYVIDLAEKLFTVDPGIVFILIGEGAEKQEIINIAKEKGILDQNVFVLDPVSKAELSQFYYETSMGSSFVINIPELWRNSANKFFDTLAAGRPVLINYGGWQKKLIERENIGFILPAEINCECAEQFALYAKNEILHKAQKENALNTAVKNYSLDIAMAKYENVFQRISI